MICSLLCPVLRAEEPLDCLGYIEAIWNQKGVMFFHIVFPAPFYCATAGGCALLSFETPHYFACSD